MSTPDKGKPTTEQESENVKQYPYKVIGLVL